MSELEQRAAVVAQARAFLGTPWVHRARVKGAGVDCGMLLAEAYEAAGVVAHVETPEYPADWALHRGEERFLAVVERYARRVDGAPQPGDIALFRYGRCISHGAIVIAWPVIVHAYLRVGAVVLDDAHANSDLGHRYAGAWSPWRTS